MQTFRNLTKTDVGVDILSIIVGQCFAIEHPKFLVDFINRWVSFIDDRLEGMTKNTVEYADVFGLRGFTYDEFRRVLETHINADKINRLPEYDYLYLDDAVAVEDFKYKYSKPDLSMREAYSMALRDAVKQEIPILYKLLCKKKLNVRLAMKSLMSHTYILSRSNTGKSEILKFWMYQLIHGSSKKKQLSITMIEPHRDLALDTLQFAAHRQNPGRIVYLDPDIRQTALELTGEDVLNTHYTFSLNPFDVGNVPKKQIGYMTEQISKAFFDIIKSEETFQMESIIEACVETLILRPDSDIVDLKRFMNDHQNNDLIEFAKKHLRGEKRSLMVDRFSTDPKIQGTKSSIYYRLQSLLGKDNLVDLLSGKSTVNLGQLMEEGQVIICNFSKASLGPVGGQLLGKLATALISGYMTLRQFKRKTERKPNFLFLDEFQNYIHEGTSEYLFAEQRKFGNYLICANQQMGQNMNTEIRRVISGNAGIKIMGPNESDSVEWMAKQMRSITPESIFNLPEYSFYFNDSANRHLGTFILRIPDYLVDSDSKYYLKKEELKQLLLYQATQSGYYRPTDEIEVTALADPNQKAEVQIKTFEHNFTR